MKFENLFHIMLICFLAITGCADRQAKIAAAQQPRLSLSADSSAVELHDLPADILEHFRTDTLTIREWQGFFAVYRDPGDPELKDIQAPLAGTYSVNDSLVVFVPDDDFVSDSGYFARYYDRNILAAPSDIVVNKRGLSAEVKVVEVVFRR